MNFQRVQVECYSGGRADERPRRVTIDGRVHVVARLLSESVEQASGSTDRVRCFEVLTEEGLTVELIRTSDGNWYLTSIRG